MICSSGVGSVGGGAAETLGKSVFFAILIMSTRQRLVDRSCIKCVVRAHLDHALVRSRWYDEGPRDETV